jgi:hypothetical protein
MLVRGAPERSRSPQFLLPFAAGLVVGILCSANSPGVAFAHDPAADMKRAADLFVTSLGEEQKVRATFPWESEKRLAWHFVPNHAIPGQGLRDGLALADMDARQRVFAHGLLSSGMSHRGYLQALTIISLEQILHNLEDKTPIRNPELYYVSIFGTPSEKGNWAWRFEGHHLSINFTILAGKLFSVTPSFFGTNPAQVRTGPFKGREGLAQEQTLARQLIRSLSDEQKQIALLDVQAPRDVITGQNRRVDQAAFTPAQGIPLDKLNGDQQEILQQLIRSYASKYRREIVDQIDGRKKIYGDNEIHFAWAGGVDKGDGHYYRIQTPTFLFEYDNTQNDANHVHAVWRDFVGDFGEDLLRQHYKSAHGAAD